MFGCCGFNRNKRFIYDRGWQLGCTFIQDDLQVGHDIYCTTWESLKKDARYDQPNISKFMDAKIVYCAEEKYRERLDKLREKTRDILLAPFSEGDYAKAEKLLKEAEHCYTQAMISELRSDVLEGAGGAIYYIENAVPMLNKKYFHYGVKRAYEELSVMENRHLAFMSLISANAMFCEIESEVEMDRYDVLEGFDAQDLNRMAELYDNIINNYRKEYRKAGIEVKHYSDIDAFVCDYQTG